MQQEWIYQFASYFLNVNDRVLVKHHERIPLPAKSFNVLVELVRARGRVVTKDELMEKVWSHSAVEESNIYQSIYRLRSVLRESPRDPIDRYIENVSGTGYRFAVPVSQVRRSTKPSPVHTVQASPTATRPVLAPLSRFVASSVGPELNNTQPDSGKAPHSYALPANGSGRNATSLDQHSGLPAPESISGVATKLDAVSFLNKLTPTERKILRMIADNRTSRDIAVEFCGSIRTIEHHRARIRAKLGLAGSNALLWFAVEHRNEIRRQCRDC